MPSDDEELWREVTQTIKPIRREKQPEGLKAPRRKRRAGRNAPAPSGDADMGRAPPVAVKARDLDRRTDDRLRRGKMQIDARIDLHGMTRDRAQDRLNEFMLSAYDSGLRCVLVITGKGKAGGAVDDAGDWATPRPGVLRESVPQWLDLPPLADKILRHYPAQPHHGGAGAFYVLLRRQRDE